MGRNSIWVLRLAIAASIVACGGGASEQRPPESAVQAVTPMPEVASTRSLSGPDGLRIEAVDFADGTALLAVSGAESDLAGNVLRYKRLQEGKGLRYQTQWTGRDWNVLVRREDSYRQRVRWLAYLPGLGETSLEYDEKASPTVDAAAMYATHMSQTQSGALEALQRFDRKAEEARHNTDLTKAAQRTGEACGTSLSVAIEWSTISDEQLLKMSPSGYCDSALSGLRSACNHPSGKAAVAKYVKSIRCLVDLPQEAEAGVMSLLDGALNWQIHFKLANLDSAAFEAFKSLTPAGAPRSIGSAITRDKTTVCADAGNGHVVVMGPREQAHGGMAYGAGETLYRVPQLRGLSGGWFLDPRHRNDKHNSNFRGYDLRFYSYVEADSDDSAAPCKVQCGTRTMELARVTGDAKHAVLDAAKYQDSPHNRAPYALARDRGGVYYYVDHGATQATEKDFRIYRGKRGRLRKQPMRDVVSDSEGEIFATRNGKLRLLVGRDNAEWVTRGGARKLKRLPLQENLGLIYNELGVYFGERLYTPCDDF